MGGGWGDEESFSNYKVPSPFHTLAEAHSNTAISPAVQTLTPYLSI